MKLVQITIYQIVLIILLLLYSFHVNAASCDPRVKEVLTQQQATYVGKVTGLANENYSRRNNSFILSTCLEKLMQSSGANILFRPPSLQGLLNQVTELACSHVEDAFSQFEFDYQLSNNSSALNILGDVNLSGQFNQFDQQKLQSGTQGSSLQFNASIGGLF